MADPETLTPDETAYFESGGQSPLPGGEKPAPEPKEGATEPKEPSEPADAGKEGEAALEPSEAKEGKGEQKTVPHEKFHAERLKVKAEREAREKIEREAAVREARLEERLNAIQAQWQANQQAEQARAQAAARPQPEPAPDKNTDPIGYMDWLERRQNAFEQAQQQTREYLARQHAAQQQAATQAQQAQAQQREQETIVNEAYGDLRAAAQEAPELDDAYKFVATTRLKQLVRLGLPEGAARQQIGNEERDLIANARQRGVRYSELIRGIAEDLGWAPKPPEPPAGQVRNEKGQFVPAASSAEERITRLENAKGASTSLGKAGGTPVGNGKLTLDQLANLPQDEFEAWMESNNKKGAGLRKLMVN